MLEEEKLEKVVGPTLISSNESVSAGESVQK